MCKERERKREREREGRTQTRKHRERERDRAVEPIPHITNPEIVKPIRHRSSQTQKSLHHSSNPRSSRRIADLIALGRSRRRSACSLWSLIFLLLLWWRGRFLFCCSLILSWSLIWWIFFLLGIKNLGFDKFGFCWIWWYICLEAEKMWETW